MLDLLEPLVALLNLAEFVDHAYRFLTYPFVRRAVGVVALAGGLLAVTDSPPLTAVAVVVALVALSPGVRALVVE